MRCEHISHPENVMCKSLQSLHTEPSYALNQHYQVTADLFYVTIESVYSRNLYKWGHKICTVSDFLYSTSLYGYTTACVYIFLLIDNEIVSQSGC